jgi:hypothetical protein
VSVNSKAFGEAHARFLTEPTALTDADLEQLGCVDQGLADRARAKRAGYVEPKPTNPDDVWFSKQPMTGGAFDQWTKDYLFPTVRCLSMQVADLQARLAEIEKRPGIDYRGVWSERELYAAGCFTTWGGGMWYARSASIGRKPGTGPEWTLAVKKGADARSAE